MNYDENSFLAGIAVGRQLKGWATAAGSITPDGRRFLYRNGAMYTGLNAVPNNPNSSWDTQLPSEFMQKEIKLIQPTIASGHIRLCGVASTVEALDTGNYTKLNVKYKVITPCTVSQGYPEGIILEQSDRMGFLNLGQAPSRAAGRLGNAGEFVLTLNTSGYLNSKFFTVIVFSDSWSTSEDRPNIYTQYADVRITEIWQSN